MNRHRLLGIAAVVLALAAPPVASAAPTNFVDPSGDNAAGADIGAVSVELGADGFIHVKVAIANMPALGGDGAVLVAFDTDRNGSTGSVAGGDYIALLELTDVTTWRLMKWDGAAYEAAAGDSTFVVGHGEIEIRVRPAALGDPIAFELFLAAGAGARGSRQLDYAPDNGSWLFEVKQVLTVETVNAKFVPAAPRAGRVFQAPVVRITLSDGSTILAPSYRCVAQLGGKLLRGTGRGGCTFKLPKNAKGKRLLVTLFVTYKAFTEEFEPYVFKVR